MKNIEIKTFKGSEVATYAEPFIKMNLDLFSEFPYLFKGSRKTIIPYLSPYFNSSNSSIILLFDKEEIVGASGSVPLTEATEGVKESFIAKNIDLTQFLYIGVIMALEKYRSWRFVNEIMKIHKKTAEAMKLLYLTAVTVDRPENHPSRPANYRDLDKLWQRFGWYKTSLLKVKSAWEQIDTNNKELNVLSVWIHPLSNKTAFEKLNIS